MDANMPANISMMALRLPIRLASHPAAKFPTIATTFMRKNASETERVACPGGVAPGELEEPPQVLRVPELDQPPARRD
jgi:hypothetical protein